METQERNTAGAFHPTSDDLRTIPAFADLVEDDLRWLAEEMTLIELLPGEVVIQSGSPADRLFVMFEGEIRGELEGPGNQNRVFIARKGQITGMLPYSRLTHFSATVRATLPTRGAFLLKDKFGPMLKRIPVMRERLIGVLTDRIRESTRAEQNRERLASLGKLSAGLAHELNNPAAAARRAADSLRQAVKNLCEANLALNKHEIPLQARQVLAELECDFAARTRPQQAQDTLERSDREEQFAAWLETHGTPDSWGLAAALVDSGFTEETLQHVATSIPEEALADALTRVTASFTITRLAEEIQSATGRMSDLVRAVKEYSYMDQMPEQEVDIHQGIENTLIMLHYHLKNGVEVLREYDRSIPKMMVRGSELNQVWTNLIVNAIDAMGGKGKLRIRTARESNDALVQVTDSGPGIDPEIRDRIFDPFFTTKSVDQGTGIGLDLVARIVSNHGGQIGFESQPGQTTFSVRIPYRLNKGISGLIPADAANAVRESGHSPDRS
ncbi:MAG TPA: ATP-binding protein [Bryobacteraceae bacterium]|nr:ATP-binding protein [Bryobacteraceae bacterium]